MRCCMHHFPLIADNNSIGSFSILDVKSVDCRRNLSEKERKDEVSLKNNILVWANNLGLAEK